MHIRRLETEAQGLRETVAATEKIRAKYGNICTQLSELQDAHLTQAKYMQKLKERASKVLSTLVFLSDFITCASIRSIPLKILSKPKKRSFPECKLYWKHSSDRGRLQGLLALHCHRHC